MFAWPAYMTVTSGTLPHAFACSRSTARRACLLSLRADGRGACDIWLKADAGESLGLVLPPCSPCAVALP
eukprot:4734111-Alexandrium_andersonii.AAC.1